MSTTLLAFSYCHPINDEATDVCWLSSVTRFRNSNAGQVRLRSRYPIWDWWVALNLKHSYIFIFSCHIEVIGTAQLSRQFWTRSGRTIPTQRHSTAATLRTLTRRLRFQSKNSASWRASRKTTLSQHSRCATYFYFLSDSLSLGQWNVLLSKRRECNPIEQWDDWSLWTCEQSSQASNWSDGN